MLPFDCFRGCFFYGACSRDCYTLRSCFGTSSLEVASVAAFVAASP
jgi:hypothetical protein